MAVVDLMTAVRLAEDEGVQANKPPLILFFLGGSQGHVGSTGGRELCLFSILSGVCHDLV